MVFSRLNMGSGLGIVRCYSLSISYKLMTHLKFVKYFLRKSNETRKNMKR